MEPIFYRTSEIYHGQVALVAQERMDAVTVRIWDRGLDEAIWEHALTAEEIAQGWYAFYDIDLSQTEYGRKHFDQLMEGYWPDPVLEVICTVRTDAGAEPLTKQAEVTDELSISARYDLKDPAEDFFHYFLEKTTYPDCFVIRTDPTPYGNIRIVYGEPVDPSPGDVAVTLVVNGQPISANACRLEVVPETYDGQTLYTYAFVMPRPASCPEHGTIEVCIVQQLLHSTGTLTRTFTIEY